MDQSKPVNLGFLSGLVPREKSMAFERILFRATRGNVFLKQAAVEDPVADPVSGEKVKQCNSFYCNDCTYFIFQLDKKQLHGACDFYMFIFIWWSDVCKSLPMNCIYHHSCLLLVGDSFFFLII